MNASDTLNTGVSIALDKVDSWTAGFFDLLPNLLVGVVFLIIFAGISLLLSSGVLRYFNRKDRQDLGRLLADFCRWIMIGIGTLIALTIVIPSMSPVDLMASFGIGSLAFGFAFKDILQNWLAGLLILLRLPFRRGDQIVVGDAEGTVLRIEPRATILRTYDGRDIIIPNTSIYTGVITINTSHEIRRIELNFTVGYVYNIRQIAGIIQNAVGSIDEILKDPPVQILCWNLGSTSLEMKIRWWINSERSQEVISRARLVQAIKEAFDANNIDPTDPQLIFYHKIEKSESEDAPDGRKAHGFMPASAAAPPEIFLSRNDPEADQPKKESKSETMLSPT